MKLDNMLDNGKAESCAPLFAASAGIDPVEALEEPWHAGHWYSRAGITDGNFYELPFHCGSYADPTTFGRVFDPIVKQVDKHLLKPPLIGYGRWYPAEVGRHENHPFGSGFAAPGTAVLHNETATRGAEDCFGSCVPPQS